MLWVTQEQVPINRQRGSYAQALARSAIDFISNGVELLLAVSTEVGTLGKVLPHEPIHVLVGAPLPGAVWVAEVHRDTRAPAQFLVHGHLFALVVRHAPAHGCGNAQQLVREGLQYVGGAGRFELGQLH